MLFRSRFRDYPIILFSVVCRLRSRALHFFTSGEGVLCVRSARGCFQAQVRANNVVKGIYRGGVPIGINGGRVGHFTPFRRVNIARFRYGIVSVIRYGIIF